MDTTQIFQKISVIGNIKSYQYGQHLRIGALLAYTHSPGAFWQQTQ